MDRQVLAPELIGRSNPGPAMRCWPISNLTVKRWNDHGLVARCQSIMALAGSHRNVSWHVPVSAISIGDYTTSPQGACVINFMIQPARAVSGHCGLSYSVFRA